MINFNLFLTIIILAFLIIPTLYGIVHKENERKDKLKLQELELVKKEEFKKLLAEKKTQLKLDVIARQEANRQKSIEKKQQTFRRKSEALAQANRIKKMMEGSCLRKKNLTESEANLVVDRHAAQNKVIYYYKCEFCSSFHMSSLPERNSSTDYLLA